MKKYYEMYGVGKTKYSVHSHDGIQTHKDGSPFFDMRIFKNKKIKDKYIKQLEKDGYVLTR